MGLIDSCAKPIPKPDILTLGPATRLVSLVEIARELRVTGSEARDWLEQLGVSVVEIDGFPYVSLYYLELALWWVLRPRALKEHILQQERPDAELLEQFNRELSTAGDLYCGLKKTAIRARTRKLFKNVSRPCQNASTPNSTSPSGKISSTDEKLILAGSNPPP